MKKKAIIFATIMFFYSVMFLPQGVSAAVPKGWDDHDCGEDCWIEICTPDQNDGCDGGLLSQSCDVECPPTK